MKLLSCDFETTSWEQDRTSVWAWATCEIDGKFETFKFGNNIDSFMKYLESLKLTKCYFHNLAFDGNFIIYYLLTNGFKHIDDKNQKEDKTFTTLISNQGQFYSIEIYFKVYNKSHYIKTTILDSMKIIPFSVDKMTKAFGLDVEKLDLDYNLKRGENHKLTKDEEDYIKNDVLIVAKSLHFLFTQKLNRMTTASNALYDFKKDIGESLYKQIFTPLVYEDYLEIKEAYKGGFTYCSPHIASKDIETGTTDLDVNSLYPSVMLNSLPYGLPEFYDGEYKTDREFPYYIQRIRCSFKIKENKIPTIQMKNSFFFKPNLYLESSNDEIVELTLTHIDLKLFLEHYDVYDFEYLYGWKFRIMSDIFKNYINKWINVKIEASKAGNNAMRTLAKLMLNSLYGKTAKAMKQISKRPVYDEDNDCIRYENKDEEITDGLYIPCAIFITSMAREITIRASQKIVDYSIKKYGKNLYYYSDTDSIKCGLTIEELSEFLEIDDYKLGAWKHENVNPEKPNTSSVRARFIRQKTYIEEIIEDGKKKLKIVCAGLPKSSYEYVNWENFKEGLTVGGKLIPKRVAGGVILVETEFTIKSSNFVMELKNFIDK